MMGAFEIVADKAKGTRFDEQREAGVVFRDICVDNGVVLRAVGDTIVCAPPLTLSRDEADIIVQTAIDSLNAAEAVLRGSGT